MRQPVIDRQEPHESKGEFSKVLNLETGLPENSLTSWSAVGILGEEGTAMRAPIGIRISTRRKALGLRQAALARMAGISASYLNLIESNKRQVAGALLKRIAEALDVDIGELNGEAEHRLIHELEEVLSDPVVQAGPAVSASARDLVALSPDIAGLLISLHRAYQQATALADAYASRLRADPMLAELLHQVLTGITAVRSSSEILAELPDLDEATQARFLNSILQQAQSLSAVSRTLIGQFDRASEVARSASPRRELDDLIFATDNHFALLEDAAVRIRSALNEWGPFSEDTLGKVLVQRFGIAVERTDTNRRDAYGFPGEYGFDAATRTLWFRNGATLATRRFQMARLIGELSEAHSIRQILSSPLLSTPAARQLAGAGMASYLAGAIVLPYDEFLASAEQLRYDIDALRERYTASFEQIAHRLVTLRRTGQSGVPFGFLRSDPAGRLTKHFPLPGLLLPSTGHACPLWAVYEAFGTPGSIVRQVVRFPDGSRYLFLAQTSARRASSFVDPVLPTSIMLACNVLDADRTLYADGLDLSDSRADIPVGPACRLCTRSDCPSRQERAWMPGEQDVPVRAPLLQNENGLGDPIGLRFSQPAS